MDRLGDHLKNKHHYVKMPVFAFCIGGYFGITLWLSVSLLKPHSACVGVLINLILQMRRLGASVICLGTSLWLQARELN